MVKTSDTRYIISSSFFSSLSLFAIWLTTATSLCSNVSLVQSFTVRPAPSVLRGVAKSESCSRPFHNNWNQEKVFTFLLSSEQNESSPEDPTEDQNVTPATSMTTSRVDEEAATSYPINLPSPVLLATSMVLAIASAGSIFELSGGSPTLGFIPSAAISVLGLPSCFFLFYAAIKKGIAETEEDDKKFLKNNRNRGF